MRIIASGNSHRDHAYPSFTRWACVRADPEDVPTDEPLDDFDIVNYLDSQAIISWPVRSNGPGAFFARKASVRRNRRGRMLVTQECGYDI